MRGILDKESIDIPCENCGRKHSKTFRWLKSNKKLTCSCGAEITIDSDQALRDIREVERSIDDFEKSMSKLFK